MRSIKKVFFLVAAFAFIELVVFAATASTAFALSPLVTKVEFSPQTVDVLSLKGNSVQFTVTTLDANGNPTPIQSVTDVKAPTINPDSLTQAYTVTLLPGSVVVGNSTFIVTYSYTDAIEKLDNQTMQISVAVVTTTTTEVLGSATVKFLAGFPAGHQCNPSASPSECYTGNTCDSSRGLCIPNIDKRKIGTFCTEVKDCDLSTGTLTLTCDDENTACVGATNNVLCSNNDVNNDVHYGKTADQLSSEQRCDTGLVCDAKELKCVNDFGQGEIPGDKLGDAATDIRDQIRNLINIALGFLGVAGVIVTLYGGFTWMAAFGDDEKVGKAKKTIVAGMIGIVIIGVAWTIVSYVLKVAEQVS